MSVAVLAVAAVGVSGPLWWPSGKPALDQVAATAQPSESVSPAGRSTPPQDQTIPTTLPDGQPYDQALVGDRASNIIDAVRAEAGYAGLHVDPQSQAIILHWAGPAPESVLTQARELAASSELVVDPTARFSRTELMAIMDMVSDHTSDELLIMSMEPNYLIGQITVQALPESPLHTATDPAALMGIADQGVKVKVELLEPEDVPTLGVG